MNDITVLLTGAGAPGASGISKSLRLTEERDIRIVAVDMRPDAYGFAFADACYPVPGGEEPEYIPRMKEIATSEGVDAILPLTTAELSPLSRSREKFSAAVMVSAVDPLATANDKGRLYQYLEREGFDSAPSYRRVETKDEFVGAVRSLGYPDNPVCFKPPVSSGMRGFRILDTETDRLTRLLEEKPGVPITTLEEVLPVLASADTFPDLAVMEYLPGKEYSVDVLATGETVGPVIPRSRTRTRAGITFEGTVEQREDLIEAATAISTQLGLEYNINLQFKYDREGQARLIEINPRVAGTIVMCVGAGVNMPYLGVKHALGETIPTQTVEWGTHMVRYWEEMFRTPDGDRRKLAGRAPARHPHPR